MPTQTPVHLDELFREAAELRLRGNWPAARRAAANLARATYGTEIYPDALEVIALIHRDSGRLGPAIHVMRMAGKSHHLLCEILLDAGRILEALQVLVELEDGSDTLVLWGRLFAAQGDKQGLRQVTEELRQRTPPPPALSADELLLFALAAEGPDQARAYWCQAMDAAARVWDIHAMRRIEQARPRIGGLTA
jgi:hypothetical protein